MCCLVFVFARAAPPLALLLMCCASCPRGDKSPLWLGHVSRQIPRKCRVTTVLGPAIPVTRNANPSDDEVRVVLERYIAGLTALFNKYKDKYDPNRLEELTII